MRQCIRTGAMGREHGKGFGTWPVRKWRIKFAPLGIVLLGVAFWGMTGEAFSQVVDFRRAVQQGAPAVVGLRLRPSQTLSEAQNPATTIDVVRVPAGPVASSPTPVGPTPTGPIPTAGSLPTPRAIEGRVRSVDEPKQLVEVTVGGDDGVRTGDAVTVYRGQEKITDLVVRGIRADTAIVQWTGDLEPGRIQKGDRVVVLTTPALVPGHRYVAQGEYQAPDGANTAQLSGGFAEVKVSGVLLSGDGLVVTAAIPTTTSVEIEATLADGRQSTARPVVHDLRTGLTLLKLNITETPHLPIGDAQVEVGMPIVVLACTDLSTRAARAGIVSAVGDDVDRPVDGMAQLDVAVAPMSAGAPVLDAEGQLLGVVVAAQNADPTGTARGAPVFVATQGHLRALLKERREDGATATIRGGMLGVVLAEDKQEKQGQPGEQGAVQVDRVIEGGAAAAAGLQVGDIVRSIDGQPVHSTLQTIRLLRGREAGEVVSLTLGRDGQELTVQATLGEAPTPESTAAPQAFAYVYGQDGALRRMMIPATTLPLGARAQVSPGTPMYGFSTAPGVPYADFLRGFPAAAAPTPPVTAPAVRVERTDVQQQLVDLHTEVKMLREQVAELVEQLKKQQDN